MSIELVHRLEQLFLRLDHMGLRVEQAVVDAVRALEEGTVEPDGEIDRRDTVIDRSEVEIEQECIRLLALYQPAAIDLRKICTIIKVNNDLERIADFAASLARQVQHVVNNHISFDNYHGYDRLSDATLEVLGATVRILNTTDAQVARRVIEMDNKVDAAYREIVHSVLQTENETSRGAAERTLTMFNIVKSMERISDLCTNIAEDVIFMRTGDIVRHPDAFSA
jgi:phosphate transport system protein